MRNHLRILGATALILAASVPARPIRVAFLKTVYTGAYLHIAIKNGTPYFEAMLKDPAGLTGAAVLTDSLRGTGAPPILPPDGFVVDTIGNGNSTGFTAANVSKLMGLLDSIDVLVLPNNIGMGGILTNPADRAKFLHFADTRGIVALHAAIDNHSSSSSAPTWAAYDSLCGVMFKDHVSHTADMRRDSLAFNTGDSAFAVLNGGLKSKYNFYEELYNPTANPRSLPGMHVLYTLDEKTYTPTTPMGDHPYVWYRSALSGNGGRYWYTAEGHTDTLYQKNYSFRRQFYNAVIWAAHADTLPHPDYASYPDPTPAPDTVASDTLPPDTTTYTDTLPSLSPTPGRPIRVAFLKTVSTGAYLHTAIKNGTPYLEAMLKDPAGLTGAAVLTDSTRGTGAPPILPSGGFIVDTIGNGNTSAFTAANISKLMGLLDSIDVLVLPNNIGMGGIISSTADRTKFLHFADTRGIIALHGADDNHSSSSTAPTWTGYDSLCGVTTKDHASHTVDMLRDSLAFNTGDSAFAVLNSGLKSKYNFYEELYSMTANPRSVPGIHILYTLDENTYTPSTRMGDHPFSWYRSSLSGNTGRYWYTAEGHTDTLYQKNYSFRRQFYNAVLWASHYDSSTGGVSPTAVHAVASSAGFRALRISVEGSMLIVSPPSNEAYTVEIRGLDGRRVAFARARGSETRIFQLNSGSIYAVTVSTRAGISHRLVTLP